MAVEEKVLTVYSPRDTKNFATALLFLLKPTIRRRSIEENQRKTTAPQAYNEGLSETEKQLLRRSLFGEIPEAAQTPGMARLFNSTLELGYPQPGKPVSWSEWMCLRKAHFDLSSGSVPA